MSLIKKMKTVNLEHVKDNVIFLQDDILNFNI